MQLLTKANIYWGSYCVTGILFCILHRSFYLILTYTKEVDTLTDEGVRFKEINWPNTPIVRAYRKVITCKDICVKGQIKKQHVKCDPTFVGKICI